MGRLTRTVLFNILCHDRKDTKNLNHDPYYYIRHSSGQGDHCIGLQSSEDVFYAREKINEWTLTCANTLNSL